ncbi:MAG: hypothetical protein EKK48_18815 [Candidatus Melainabacteria bacterium]|nr:MAG: hypothetical protein EKK48_18815 [Candidatus Melainabacteria bacterium]
MPAIEDWRPSEQHSPELLMAQAGGKESKLLSDSIRDAWTVCPDGTAQKLKPGQTRADACGDQT